MTGDINNLRFSSAAYITASPLVRAALLSVALHCAMAFMSQALRGGELQKTFERAAPLRVMFSVPVAEGSAEDALLTHAGGAPELNGALPASTPPAATRGATPAARTRFGHGAPGEILVQPAMLEDRNRLGDLLSRELSEFPVEVDLPVRLRDPIAVRYPAAALAAGRQGSVVVWIVVNTIGKADEVRVVDGPEELAAAVLEALRDIYFLPAQDNRRLIAFPLSLDFSFQLPGTPGQETLAGSYRSRH